MDRGKRLERDFYARDVEEVACDLLGTVLVRGDRAGRIVEAEAYRGESDPASHATAGRTARNASMFGEPGTAYVYISYGIHTMLNAVTGEDGRPSAVLVRAVEPLQGVDAMRAARGRDDLTALCSGPGKLCEAFGIEPSHDGTDLVDGPFHVAHGDPVPDGAVSRSARIGVESEAPLRFFLEDPHVSR